MGNEEKKKERKEKKEKRKRREGGGIRRSTARVEIIFGTMHTVLAFSRVLQADAATVFFFRRATGRRAVAGRAALRIGGVSNI